MKHLLPAVALALLLFAPACDSTSPDSFGDKAPSLIEAEAFQIDTDLFAATTKVQAGANFTAAALRVWPVSTIISANLVIPGIVTAAATQSEPTFNDGAWVWSNTTSTDEGTATFTLSVTPNADGLDWVMEVSLPARNLDEFVLYTAHTALDGKVGTWQLYYPFEGVSENVLTADFLVTDENAKSLTFAVMGGPYEAVGDSVEYGKDGTDRTFDWDQKSEGKTHVVVWDSVTKAGSITASDYNGGQTACWDVNLDDVTCAS